MCSYVDICISSLKGKKTLTECVHELVVPLLPVGSSVGHWVAVGGRLAERPGSVVLAVAAAVVAPRGAGRVGGAAAAAAAHLLDHLHLCSQFCQQQQMFFISTDPFIQIFVRTRRTRSLK